MPYDAFDEAQAVQRLKAARLKVAAILTAIVVVAYFGFILLVAFGKPTMGTLLVPGLSFGLLLGAILILGSWILTWIYANWANTKFDAMVNEVIGQGKPRA